MTITHRQRLIDAVEARLSRLVTPDYGTNVGRRVFDSRDPLGEPFSDNELPASWFRDTTNEITAVDASVDEHSITLEIGAHDFGADAPAVGRLIEGEILKVIGEDKTFGGLCHYCRPTGSTIEVKSEGRRQVGVRITFEVKFRTKAFDPFTFHAGPE